VLTTTLVVVAVALCLYLLYLLRRPLAYLGIAGFIALALAPAVGWLSQYMSRGLAIFLAYLAVILTPVGLFLIVVPPLAREAADFIDEAPRYAADFERFVEDNKRLRELDAEYGISDKVRQELNELPSRAGDAASWLGDLGLGIVNSAFAGVTILILSVFLLANGRRWLEAVLDLQAPGRAQAIRPTLDRMAAAVGGYVAGALFQSLVAGVTTYIVLTILGVPFAGPMAVVVALFDLIPMVGATIAAVFVGIITLFADFPVDTIIWAIWAIVYQQLENNVIQPRIQNRAVGVHPFGIIVAVLFGGTLLGVPGALLAVPVAASLQIALRDWWAWRQRRLQEAGRVEAGPGEAAAAKPATEPTIATSRR